MSAQRRTASKRESTATAPPPRRAPVGGGARPAPAAQAAPARPPASPPRPPKPAERAKAAPETGARGALNTRTEGLRRIYADTVSEMRKINWPDRETTKNLTLVVIAVSVVLGILLGGIDFVLQALFESLP